MYEMKKMMKTCLGECDKEIIKCIFDHSFFMVCLNRALCKTMICLTPDLCGGKFWLCRVLLVEPLTTELGQNMTCLL